MYGILVDSPEFCDSLLNVGTFMLTMHLYAFRLNLSSFVWTQLKTGDITERYEHSAYVPSCNPSEVYVFGGANKLNNLNSIQAINIGMYFSMQG